ncbi:YpzG family protein [Mesobacillus harenae]|uniref:YpzG family protein n=1 Tax=Mesobacillus harenae TaxID=2213203 RepID=UPI0015812741|nr:YpzG family protein [Mesobacillus harenae]
MGRTKNLFDHNPYVSPFTAPWYKPRNARSQNNSENRYQDLKVLDQRKRDL